MVGSGDGNSSSLSSEAFYSFISSSAFCYGSEWKAIRFRFSVGDTSAVDSDFESMADVPPERLLVLLF